MQTARICVVRRVLAGACVLSLLLGVDTVCGVNAWMGPASGDWFVPGNWSEGVPTNAAAVTVGTGSSILLTNATAAMGSFQLASGATLTFKGWNSPLTARELTISGTLTHLDHLSITQTNALGGWDTVHRILLQGSNITIASGATLNADWKGYPRLAGPGRSLTSRDGAGHAGLGGSGYLNPGGGGAPYGEPDQPSQPGSGGGEATKGGEGGGVIRIAAEGHLAISGTLSAIGRNGAVSHGGGGSGGSVWMNCRTFGGAATGLLRVNGGNGQSQGSGGAGGRLALHYDVDAQRALAVPVPPVRFFSQAGVRGGSGYAAFPAGMGTLYLPDTLFITETIAGQRLWHVRLVIPGFAEWEPQALTVNNCVMGFPEGFRLAVTNDLLLTNNAALHFFAAPVTDPLTEDGAVVEVGEDLILAGNSWIFPYASDTNGASVGFSVAGNLTVAAGSGFNADDLGHRWQSGLGGLAARFTYLGTGQNFAGSSGTGYGGGGGNGWNCNGCMGYGVADAPRWPGTGSRTLYSARGGGAIRIAVDGHAEISGWLTATGSRGNGGSAYGSASGGGIWLTCRTLGGASTGLFRVDGGAAGNIDGAGGGGRIAVFYNAEAQSLAPAPACAFSAAGGARGVSSPQRGAEMGTLYLPDSQLMQALAEGGRFRKVRLVIPGFTQWSPASLTLNGGEFMFPVGFSLDVAGSMTLLSGAGIHLLAAPTNAPGACGARLTVGGDLHIAANAWLYPYADWTNGAVVGIRVAGNVTIAAGGGIDADGKGYTPIGSNLNGPGAGKNSLSGGGYGGAGGGTGGGARYGRAELPLQPGSPAGWYLYSYGLRAGQGGGAIRLLAGGDILLDGVLSANAMPKEASYGGTGASGGAIFVAGRRLTGGGVLRASGALNQDRANADGGGGRIAVWVGMPLQAVEAKLATADVGTLFRKETYSSFDGKLEALRASTVAADGTTGIYGRDGTCFIVR